MTLLMFFIHYLYNKKWLSVGGIIVHDRNVSGWVIYIHTSKSKASSIGAKVVMKERKLAFGRSVFRSPRRLFESFLTFPTHIDCVIDDATRKHFFVCVCFIAASEA